MDLEDYSIDELKDELDRRKKLKDKPVMLDTPDLKSLRSECEAYMNSIASGEYHEDGDEAQYIFEVAMESFYGKKVWTWINANT